MVKERIRGEFRGTHGFSQVLLPLLVAGERQGMGGGVREQEHRGRRGGRECLAHTSSKKPVFWDEGWWRSQRGLSPAGPPVIPNSKPEQEPPRGPRRRAHQCWSECGGPSWTGQYFLTVRCCGIWSFLPAGALRILQG